jgi:hypothetical protein
LILKLNFSDFSEKNLFKKFQKKYPTIVWEITEKAIIESLKRIYRLKDTDRLDCIKFCEPYGLFNFHPLYFQYFDVNGISADTAPQLVDIIKPYPQGLESFTTVT